MAMDMVFLEGYFAILGAGNEDDYVEHLVRAIQGKEIEWGFWNWNVLLFEGWKSTKILKSYYQLKKNNVKL